MSRSKQPDLEILYEDNHLIAVNKRPGQLSQGDETGDAPLGDLVKDYLKSKYEKSGKVYLGVLHRLDRPVSGVTLFARTSKAAERVSKAFREGKVEKEYWAITLQRPKLEAGNLTHYLRHSFDKNLAQTFLKPVPGSKKANLSYELLAAIGKSYLLKVMPRTGRKHQIRAQLARLGSPIKGDIKYGAAKRNRDGSIHLHARRLSLQHPVSGETIAITAPINIKDNTWKMFAEHQD